MRANDSDDECHSLFVRSSCDFFDEAAMIKPIHSVDLNIAKVLFVHGRVVVLSFLGLGHSEVDALEQG
jgi:hypothetical protein